MPRRCRRTGTAGIGATVLAALLLVWPLGPGGRAQAMPEATGFLSELTDRSVRQLTEPGIGAEEKQRRFRALVNEGFDLPAIARFVLGRYWHGASPEERAAFQSIFEELLVHRFLPLFAEYHGEKLNIVAARPFAADPDFVNVVSKLRREQGGPIAVDWRIRRVDGGFKIVDIVAEGVSIAVTLRSEYAEVLQQNGGSVGRLIETLRARLERL